MKILSAIALLLFMKILTGTVKEEWFISWKLQKKTNLKQLSEIVE